MLGGRSNNNESRGIYSLHLPLLTFYDFFSELGNRQNTYVYSCGTKGHERRFCDQYSIICKSLWKGHSLLASSSLRFPAHNWTPKMWQVIQYEWIDLVLKLIINISSFSFMLMESHLKLCDVPPRLMKNSDPPACGITIILEAWSSLNIFKIL